MRPLIAQTGKSHLATPVTSDRTAKIISSDLIGVIRKHYLRLSQSSRRMRFLMTVADKAIEQKKIPQKAPDLLLGTEVDGETRGILEIFKTAGGHAEVAISVEDRYQGMGYGKRLLEAGISHARRMGIKEIDFYFARENIGVQYLIASLGGEIRFRGHEAEAHMLIKDEATP